jgi:hypothetical protein
MFGIDGLGESACIAKLITAALINVPTTNAVVIAVAADAVATRCCC